MKFMLLTIVTLGLYPVFVLLRMLVRCLSTWPSNARSTRASADMDRRQPGEPEHLGRTALPAPRNRVRRQVTRLVTESRIH